MAVLLSRQTGNFTTASTWGLVENSTFTPSLATQETGSTPLTTAYQSGTNFTVPTTQTLEGLALKLASRLTTGGNTVTARIYNVTGAIAVANTTVTLDVLDMPNGIAWVYFKFPASATLNTAINYRVEIISNIAGSASFYRKNATAANWTFGLVTTTQQAPAAADQLLVTGTNSSFNVFQDVEVTVNNTATTVFGPNVAGTMAIEISGKGVLKYSTAAGSNFRLDLDGNVSINQDGILKMGESSAPINSTSTATLKFDCASNVQYGMNIRTGGSFITYGTAKTGAATLQTTAIPNALSLTTNETTGWLSGDSLAISSTNRGQIAQAEVVTMSGAASGTTVPCSLVVNEHDGSASSIEARADVINLTRNVIVQGVNATLQTYINTAATCTVSCTNATLQYFGSATATARGVECNVTSGTFSFTGCAFAYFEVLGSSGILINSATSIALIDDCVFYRQASVAVGMNSLVTLTGNTVTVNNCVAIGGALMGSVALYNLTVNAGVYTNLVGANGSVSAFILQSTAISPSLISNNWKAYVCTSSNIQLNTISENADSNALFEDVISFRSAAEGILLGSSTTGACINTVIDGGRLFGNGTRGLTAGFVFSCSVRNMMIYNETGYDQPNGVVFNNHVENTYFDNCHIGFELAHSSSDVRDVCPRNEHIATFRNCKFGSTTEFAGTSNYTPQSYVGSARHNEVAGVHKLFKKFGNITLDTVFYKVQSPSQRMTPNNATNKLWSQEKRVAVPDGQAAQISVWVRKSIIGDGTAYNGSEVEIVALRDPAIGINSDTVLATTSSLAFGDFEKITGTTPVITDNGVVRLMVTCDGTQGWINVDLWTVEIV